MSLRGKLVVGIALTAMCTILGLMPLSLLFLPEPEAVRIKGLSGEQSGAYLDAPNGLFRLYPYSSLRTGFPKLVPQTGGEPTFLIKYRALEAKSAYAIYSYSGRQEIPAAKMEKAGKVLRVTPETALRPGRYYLKAAKDSMYGGSEYFFFHIPPAADQDSTRL